MVLLHEFIKKTSKITVREIEIVRERMGDCK